MSGPLGLRTDIDRFYAEWLARHRPAITLDPLSVPATTYVVESRGQAIQKAGPYALCFSQTLFIHGNITEASLKPQPGYINYDMHDCVRLENLAALSGDQSRFHEMIMPSLERNDRLA